MDDNNKKSLKDEKGKDLSSQLDKFLGALNFSRKEISRKKTVEEDAHFEMTEAQETFLQSEIEEREEERENIEMDLKFRGPEEEQIDFIAQLREESEKNSDKEAGELDGLFSIHEDLNKATQPPSFSETSVSKEEEQTEVPMMIGFDEEVDIDQIKTSLEEFSNGRENVELHQVEENIEANWDSFQTLEAVESPQESDPVPEQSKAQLTNEDIEVRNGIVIDQEEAEDAAEERAEEDAVKIREEDGAEPENHQEKLAEQEDEFAEQYEMQEQEGQMDENRIRREGYRSLDQHIKKEMGADIEKLKMSGYKPQGFVFDEGVNSKTVPEVAKILEITSDGRIDFDKIVGGNRLLKIDSIYHFHHLIKQMRDTVFMIELYSRTMPPNIPNEVKRESVLNIIKASSIQIEDLLQDAYQRIDVLNEVLEDVAQKVEELDKQNADEIERLEEQIQELKLKIQRRSNFKQSQNAMIGYEIQRIVNIIEFIES